MAMTVSKIASKAGLSADTVRYYERIGLLEPPDRTPSGYRMYDEGAIERLRFVKSAQRLGLSLTEIAELLDIRDRGLCPCGHTDGLLRRRIEELDAEIRRLASMRAELARMIEARAKVTNPVADVAETHCAGDVFPLEWPTIGPKEVNQNHA